MELLTQDRKIECRSTFWLQMRVNEGERRAVSEIIGRQVFSSLHLSLLALRKPLCISTVKGANGQGLNELCYLRCLVIFYPEETGREPESSP
jgi:hypothetical protein